MTKAEELLRDLLATINRGGGHHTHTLGLEAATLSAIDVVAGLRNDLRALSDQNHDLLRIQKRDRAEWDRCRNEMGALQSRLDEARDKTRFDLARRKDLARGPRGA